MRETDRNVARRPLGYAFGRFWSFSVQRGFINEANQCRDTAYPHSNCADFNFKVHIDSGNRPEHDLEADGDAEITGMIDVSLHQTGDSCVQQGKKDDPGRKSIAIRLGAGRKAAGAGFIKISSDRECFEVVQIVKKIL